MHYMDRKRAHVLFVPNEDGFGPSALTSNLVKGLLRLKPNWQVTVWNRSRLKYNQTTYKREITAGQLAVESVWNIIELVKGTGQVLVERTFESLKGYLKLSDTYAEDRRFQKFDLVVDFGVPAAVKWARRTGMTTLSVFDHSWSLSLEMLLQNTPGILGHATKKRNAEQLIEVIRADERLTERLFLFPAFISPPRYLDYWQKILGVERVTSVDGVFGPLLETDSNLLSCRRPIGARQVFFQGGNTPAWDHILCRTASLLVANPEALSVHDVGLTIYIPNKLRDEREIRRLLDTANDRVVVVDALERGAVCKLMSEIDFLVTRAGGGTVNDAVALRVPIGNAHCVSPRQDTTRPLSKPSKLPFPLPLRPGSTAVIHHAAWKHWRP